MVRPTSGTITFQGRDLLSLSAAQRAHLGIAHVPEGRQVFKTLTVRENLEMGAYPQSGRVNWTRTLDRIHTLFPILAERAQQMAGTLSGGEQQMVAIGRGLACAPKLLMLDEPSMGLAPAITDTIFERISQIHTRRCDHPAGRATRRRGAGAVRPWLRAGNGPHGVGRPV